MADAHVTVTQRLKVPTLSVLTGYTGLCGFIIFNFSKFLLYLISVCELRLITIGYVNLSAGTKINRKKEIAQQQVPVVISRGNCDKCIRNTNQLINYAFHEDAAYSFDSESCSVRLRRQ